VIAHNTEQHCGFGSAVARENRTLYLGIINPALATQTL